MRRTACGAAAYMSCSRLYNNYDGIQHDYTRKGGLVWEHIFLPTMAPVEWSDRETLWNAVEAAEKAKDSRLAREFIVALPRELGAEDWKATMIEYIQNCFVSDGMCADVAIHDTDGHNPHAHILLTVRPLNEGGKWQRKTEKEYLCVRGGEERGFTAAEFKTAQGEGWEKQYPYKVGRKKEYMTPSETEAKGYERTSKHPKSTKYGRQNPISERWNSDEQLVLWREAWANAVNRTLKRYGFEERVDHRSNAVRGLDEQPTVHEGVTARALEAKGVISDRCELNRQIKEKSAERRSMKKELATLSPLSVFKRSELKKQIAQLSEEIEELTFSKNEIVTGFGKEDDKEMPAVPKQITAVKANVAKMDELEARYTGDIEKSGREFGRLKEKVKQYDLYDLTDARLALRPQMEDEAQECIKNDIPDEKLSFWNFQISASMTDEQNREDGMETWYKEQTMRRRLAQEYQQRREQP